MSYVFHADVYRAEVALGIYEGSRCALCGEPVPRDFYVSSRRVFCSGLCNTRSHAIKSKESKCK
jgi:hypothetical protein